MMGVVGPKGGEGERQDRAGPEARAFEGAGSPDPWVAGARKDLVLSCSPLSPSGAGSP